jgi:hypothetical protein
MLPVGYENIANVVGELSHIEERGPILRTGDTLTDLVDHAIEDRIDPAAHTVLPLGAARVGRRFEQLSVAMSFRPTN